MTRDESILDIFQDPLLTLIALILLSAIPVVMPDWEHDKTQPALEGRPFHEIQARIDELKGEIQTLDKQIDALKEALVRLREELQAARAQRAQRKDDLLAREQRINRLLADITTIRSVIEQRQKEMEKLQQELAAAKAATEETKRSQQLEEEIKRITRALAEKRTLLEGVEQELEKEKKGLAKKRQVEENQASKIVRLGTELEIARRQMQLLEEEKTEVEKSFSKMGGMGQYTQEAVGDRSGTAFEASQNRLFSLDEHNYRSEVLRGKHQGAVITFKKFTRKDTARGEHQEAIGKEGSRFQSKLKELNPKKDYLIFLVQKDSFEVFLKARKMAWDRGFVVGWQPFDGGAIYAGPGKGEGR